MAEIVLFAHEIPADLAEYFEPIPPGAKSDTWTIPTSPYPNAHFATFPPDLIRPCIMAGSRSGDLVCDPFMGSGTVAQVCVEEGRDWTGCDLDERAEGWLRDRLAGLPVGRLVVV